MAHPVDFAEELVDFAGRLGNQPVYERSIGYVLFDKGANYAVPCIFTEDLAILKSTIRICESFDVVVERGKSGYINDVIGCKVGPCEHAGLDTAGDNLVAH